MRNYCLFIICMLVALVVTGCGNDISKDPEKLLQTVKSSPLGTVYSSYSYFANPKWKSIKDKGDTYLVQFESEYDMAKIMADTCEKEDFEKWSSEEQKAIKGMMHVAVFGLENDQVVPRFSGWGLSCSNGETKSYDDKEMHTLQEVQQNTWLTDCATMRKLEGLCLKASSKKKEE